MAKDDKFKSWFNSSTGQKIVFGSLLLLGFFIIFLGFTLLKANIKSPFLGHTGWESYQQQGTEAQVSDLKSKDTDGDGLSDYDEIYTYGTSPYLADSDSDGYADKQEIETGNNPLCSSGNKCGVFNPAGSSANGSLDLNQQLSLPLEQSGNNNELQNTVTTTELRKLLEQAGVSKDILDKTDDATLLELYQETMKESGTGSLNTSNININTNTEINSSEDNSSPTTEELNNMSAGQIRELLISSGMDKQTIDSFDDETLKKIFLESVKESQAQTQ